MSNPIGWTDQTWNPITGCTKVSEGCLHCYAERMSERLAGRYGYPADHPFRVTLHSDKLVEPVRWRKPRHVFVCSMGDLFHDDVPFDRIMDVWDVMGECSQHTFQVLTKRPERMREFARWMEDVELMRCAHSNVWLGVTAENQARANERIPVLLDTPAAVRFVSVEPMLEPVDIMPWLHSLSRTDTALDWVICGPETGPGARPFDIQWACDLRDQCAEAGVPFWFKGGLLDGVEWHERPDHA